MNWLEWYYRQHWGYLRSIALRYLLNERQADRIVNACFQQFARAVESGRQRLPVEDEAIRERLTRILLPVVLNVLLKEPSTWKRLTGVWLAVYPYDQILAKLSPLERAVFNLVTVDRFTHGQAARLVGISRSVCKLYHCRAIRKLQHHWIRQQQRRTIFQAAIVSTLL